MERDFHAEAEQRLGRPLTHAELFIDLAADDATIEAAKEQLVAAVEKEKRRQIRRFLDGEEPRMRLTQEMVEILVRLRLAGMDAAESEIERMTRPVERQMVHRWQDPRHEPRRFTVMLGADNRPGYDVWDHDKAMTVLKTERREDAVRAAHALNQLPDHFDVGFLPDGGELMHAWRVDQPDAPMLAWNPSHAIDLPGHLNQLTQGEQSLTAQIEARVPGWVWHDEYQMFVPKVERLQEPYFRLAEHDFADSADRVLLGQGYNQADIREARNAHLWGVGPDGHALPPGRADAVHPPGEEWAAQLRNAQAAAKPGPFSNWVPHYDDTRGMWVAVDQNGVAAKLTAMPDQPRKWLNRSGAENWINRQAGPANPFQVKAATELPSKGWAGTPHDWAIDHITAAPRGDYGVFDLHGNLVKAFPGNEDASGWGEANSWLNRVAAGEEPIPPNVQPPHFGTEPFIPHESVIQAERNRLIQEAILRATIAPNPAQMMLFDPQLYPFMQQFKENLRGIEKRITKEGLAQVEFGQGAGVEALARAIDKKVPGALDAASRMVSGPFNAGLGDVYRMKNGLFKRWQYSAVMDKATCEVCAYFDGTVYYSWNAIAEAPGAPLPGGGPNPACFGGSRCRCRPVPYFGAAHVGDVEPHPGGPTPDTPFETTMSSLSSDDITDITDLGGGVSTTKRGLLPDGTEVKIAPFDGHPPIYDQIPPYSDGNNEMANWLIAKRYFMGGDVYVNVPPHVIKDFPDLGPCDVSYMIPGLESGGDPTPEEIPGWALFDSICGQHDHHGNNATTAWGSGGDGKFWLIDNGLSFPSYTDDRNDGHERPWETYYNEFGSYDLTPSMKKTLQRIVADKSQLDDDLKSYLDSNQREAMWERIDRMLESGQLVGNMGAPLEYGGGW